MVTTVSLAGARTPVQASKQHYRRHVTGSGAGSLTAAVQAGLAGAGIPSLSAGVQRLMTAYRSGEVPAAPVMAARADAAAYAAYRMPATVAATGQALRELWQSLPGWAPRTLVDFGAGTGGAAWAVADQLPSVESMTLLEQSADAIRLGKAILAAAEAPSLRTATWRAWQLPADAALPAAGLPAAGLPSADLATTVGPASADPATGPGPAGADPGTDLGPAGADLATAGPAAADLATAAYVLGELTPAQQWALVALAAQAAPAVLLVEPGTPAGHRRILAARAQLLAAGYVVAAPCPHQLGCPLAVAGDWCHFGARLQRSAVHRQAKDVELSYEDEKYSYVAAVRSDGRSLAAPEGRIVRRPQQRKGLVTLSLCTRDGTIRRDLVSKSKGEAYRQARKISWGDSWPPADQGRQT
jgi:ribosomal protein RSM22 (predicted rRNA methylase)